MKGLNLPVSDRDVRLARSILALYASIFYLVPMVMTALFGQPLNDVLASVPSYTAGSIYIIVTVGLIWWMCGKLRVPDFRALAPLARIMFHRFAILSVAALTVYLSWLFSRELGLSFRQTGARIEAAGSFVIVLLVAQAYLLSALVLLLGLSQEQIRAMGWPITVALLLSAFGFYLSLAASSGVVAIAISAILLIRSATGFELLRGGDSKRSFWTIVFFVVVGVFASFVGIANKRGVDVAFYMFTSDIGSVVRILQMRISYHFYTASFHTTYNLTDFSLGFQAVNEVVNAISHRFDVLFGNPTFADEIWSVRRLNFEEISFFYRERTGAAPGLVGGTFFVPGGVLVLPLSCAIYSAMFLMIAKAANGRALSLFGLAYLAMYFIGIGDSAIDLLNPFDPAFVKLIFLMFVCAWQASRRAGESVYATIDGGAPLAPVVHAAR